MSLMPRLAGRWVPPFNIGPHGASMVDTRAILKPWNGFSFSRKYETAIRSDEHVTPPAAGAPTKRAVG